MSSLREKNVRKSGLGMITLALFLAAFVLGAPHRLLAQIPDYVIVVDDKTTKAGKEAVKDPQYGEGTKEKFEITFKVKVTNTKQEPLSGVTLRLIPYFIQYDWNSKEEGHTPGKIQEVKDLTFPSGEEKTFELSPMKAESQQTYNKNTRTSWRSGEEYIGCVIELLQDGKVVVFKVAGDSKVRKAYEAAAKKPTP